MKPKFRVGQTVYWAYTDNSVQDHGQIIDGIDTSPRYVVKVIKGKVESCEKDHPIFHVPTYFVFDESRDRKSFGSVEVPEYQLFKSINELKRVKLIKYEMEN